MPQGIGRKDCRWCGWSGDVAPRVVKCPRCGSPRSLAAPVRYKGELPPPPPLLDPLTGA